MALIRINHLGAISSFDFEIKQFNLFIGEQASGKSTICKAIYFFKIIKNELVNYLYNIAVDGRKQDVFPKALNSVLKNIFVNLFGYSWELPSDLNLEYIYKENISVSVSLKQRTNEKKYINIQFNEELKSEIKKVEQELLNYHDNTRTFDDMSSFTAIERQRLHQEIITKINSLLDDELPAYYLPAGRSLLTLMTNQKTKLDYDTIDLINRTFIQFIESIQSKFDLGISNLHKYFPVEQRKFDAVKMAQNIIKNFKGEYIHLKGREYIKLPNSEEKIPINFVSSGQQEVLWVFNLLYLFLLRNEKSFVIIEEPEAHLYPSLQKYVLDFIVQFMNITNSTVILTTHSPYLLTNANNLLYAGRIKSKNINGAEEIIGKYNYIKPDNIKICKLSQKSGRTECQSLINDKINELETEVIDEISDDINKVYNELYDLENRVGN